MKQRVYGINPQIVIEFIETIKDGYYGLHWGNSDPQRLIQGISKLPVNETGLVQTAKLGHFLMDVSTSKCPAGANKALNRIKDFARQNRDVYSEAE